MTFKDERIEKLAHLLVHHSVKLKPKEKVLITAPYAAKPLVLSIIKKVYDNGSYPYLDLFDDELSTAINADAEREALEVRAAWDMKKFKDIDASITIVAEENDAEFSDIPAEKMKLIGEVLKEPGDFLIANRRWVLLNWPTPGLAQKAGMSTGKFTDYLLDVCNVDYEKLAESQKPLVSLMEKTDRVRIVSPGTDLTFSIKSIPVIPCAGECNVPDGEVYTAPVKDSVNGTITFNTPSPYNGTVFRNIKLTFRDGKVVEAVSDHTDKLNEILDIDEGARYVGEFAIGLNPLISEPMGDILFDEKICGSIHFTPGAAYDEADNGNDSSVHWDMVLIQRPEYGGGELYFDDVLIRKDGMFVHEDLKGLNPENLK